MKKNTGNIKQHVNYNEADYSYLRNKGYTDDEILRIWDRQDGPCGHENKAFDTVTYLNQQN